MTTKFEALLTTIHENHDLEKARAVLMWDQEVNMPTAGREARIQQITTLSRIIHKKSTSDSFGELIAASAAEINGAAYDSDEAALIRYLQRTYEDARKLTPDFVQRMAEVSGIARHAWVKARAENDFPAFRPHLETVVAMCREMAELYGYDDEAYDPLLDKYEYGMKTAVVRDIFAAVKKELIPLREAVAEKDTAVSDALVHQAYPIDKQKIFARYIADAVGYDFERGHLGTVVHPFATSFSRNDARITTRWYPDFLNPSLFGTLHESGHAMYEQGTHFSLARTPLARGTSSGIHESQSRMIENIVGRSRGFWQAHFPKLQSLFPEQLDSATAADFYKAVNKVQPSFIRVEADELTYNFHIILRFELEQALLNGDLAVADLPAAWNDKMNEMLGVVPPTDTLGCLQDVHWTRPGFGYFPTYSLGAMASAQIFAAAQRDNSDILPGLGRGDIRPLFDWLDLNVRSQGCLYLPDELIEKATGSPLDTAAFKASIKARYLD